MTAPPIRVEFRERTGPADWRVLSLGPDHYDMYGQPSPWSALPAVGDVVWIQDRTYRVVRRVWLDHPMPGASTPKHWVAVEVASLPEPQHLEASAAEEDRVCQIVAEAITPQDCGDAATAGAHAVASLAGRTMQVTLAAVRAPLARSFGDLVAGGFTWSTDDAGGDRGVAGAGA